MRLTALRARIRIALVVVNEFAAVAVFARRKWIQHLQRVPLPDGPLDGAFRRMVRLDFGGLGLRDAMLRRHEILRPE